MVNKGKDIVAISLSDEVLKIAEVKGNGVGAKVKLVTAVDVRGISEDDLPKTVRSALSGFNTKSAQMVAVVPSGMATTKNIEIPSTDPEEIQSIVNLQAGRHTPYSREEIQVGYINLGVFNQNFTKVLLVIANRTVLKKQMGIYEKAGITIKDVLFAPENIAEFYGQAYQLGSQAEPVAVIDIGKYSSDFIMIQNSRVVGTRNIPVGKSQMAADGVPARTKLLDELKKTLDAIQGEDGAQIPQLYYLSHDDAICQEMQGAIQSQLGWNVSSASYLQHLKPSKKVVKAVTEDFTDCSFLDVVSTAAVGPSARVNLLPEEVQLQKSIEDQSREVVKSAILVMVIICLVAAAFGIKVYFRRAFLNEMRSEYGPVRQEVKDLEVVKAKNMIIKDYLTSRMVSLDVVRELYRALPKEMYLTNMSMEKDGTVTIKGVSDIGSSVYNFNTTLKELDLFTNAEVISKSAKKDRGIDAHAFEISLALPSAAVSETEEE